jgi:hypothetical protein
MNKKTNKKEYIIQYWVGLMDGDGSIQVNHWRMRSLQYRLVIKLKMCNENLNLLQQIQEVVGGGVKVQSNNKFVLWVENHKSKIQKIVKHFQLYPPLTTRLCLQLEFLFECLRKNDVNWYLENRKYKYRHRVDNSATLSSIKMLDNSKISLRPYYKVWLSGFIEAEGCFCVRANSSCSFSIAQNDDKYLIESIKNEFGACNAIRSIQKEEHKPFLIENPLKCSTITDNNSINPVDSINPVHSIKSVHLESKINPKVKLQTNPKVKLQTNPKVKLQSNPKVKLQSNPKVKLQSNPKDDQIITEGNKLFIFEVYRKEVLKRIISHCTLYPLLGEKNKSFLLFKEQII